MNINRIVGENRQAWVIIMAADINVTGIDGFRQAVTFFVQEMKKNVILYNKRDLMY